jgi:hypothetical protein
LWQTDDFAILPDGPGWPKNTGRPSTYKANFYVVAWSKTDGKIKARIWYDVLIDVDASGKVKQNEVKFTDSDPK